MATARACTSRTDGTRGVLGSVRKDHVARTLRASARVSRAERRFQKMPSGETGGQRYAPTSLSRVRENGCAGNGASSGHPGDSSASRGHRAFTARAIGAHESSTLSASARLELRRGSAAVQLAVSATPAQGKARRLPADAHHRLGLARLDQRPENDGTETPPKPPVSVGRSGSRDRGESSAIEYGYGPTPLSPRGVHELAHGPFPVSTCRRAGRQIPASLQSRATFGRGVARAILTGRSA